MDNIDEIIGKLFGGSRLEYLKIDSNKTNVELADIWVDNHELTNQEFNKIQVLDKYFQGGLSIKDKTYIIALSEMFSKKLDNVIKMTESFANNINSMQRFKRVKFDLTDYIERDGDFSKEYKEKRASDPYDWLNCITPRRNFENKYIMSQNTYYEWANIKKYLKIVPETKLDYICRELALFTEKNISKEYIVGMTIMDKIIERIQKTKNHNFRDIVLTTTEYNNINVFDILSPKLLNEIKNIVSE